MKSLKTEIGHPERIQLLVSDNWWDGTLSGYCEYKGTIYQYNNIIDKHDRPRVYGIYEIPNLLNWELRNIIRMIWNSDYSMGHDYNNRNTFGKHFDSIENKDLLAYYKLIANQYPEFVLSDTFNSDNLIGYFDGLEYRFRDKVDRDYFVDGEISYTDHHEPGCELKGFIKFSEDAVDLSAMINDVNFDGEDIISECWTIQVNKSKLSIEYCPWCGKKLSTKKRVSSI